MLTNLVITKYGRKDEATDGRWPVERAGVAGPQ